MRGRADTALEVLALRRCEVSEPALLSRSRHCNLQENPFSSQPLYIQTVVKWHRAGFRLYWRWKSRSRGGRPRIAEEIRVLIWRLAQENPDWGAPKIHGELQKLGFVVSERAIARYLRRIQSRGDPGQKWLAFLSNHREAIVAFDLFTVPTATFRVLYCFFVIEHARRRILHFNVTRHPSADWVVQQLREAPIQ